MCTTIQASVVLLLIPYLVTGAMFTRSWPRYEESGKSFLLLVFPFHVFVYLLFVGVDAAQVREAMRNAIAILVFILLLMWLSR